MQWLAVFLYVFDPYMFLVPASAMRQNVGIVLFLIAIEFLYKKKKHIIVYLALTVVAATFHKTAYVLPPLVLLAFINIKISKLVATGIVFIFASLFLFGNQLYPYVNILVEAVFPKYAHYLYGSGSSFNTGIGFAYAMFQLISILYFAGIEFHEEQELFVPEQPQDSDTLYPQEDSGVLPVDPHAVFLNLKARRLLFKLAIITFLFMPLGMQLLMNGT